LTRDLT